MEGNLLHCFVMRRGLQKIELEESFVIYNMPDCFESLLKAQEVMKTQADKHRRKVELRVYDMVYLKLRMYRQQMMVNRCE